MPDDNGDPWGPVIVQAPFWDEAVHNLAWALRALNTGRPISCEDAIELAGLTERVREAVLARLDEDEPA